jgi:hypothetical protein
MLAITIAAVNSPIKPNKIFLGPVMIEFPRGYSTLNAPYLLTVSLFGNSDRERGK